MWAWVLKTDRRHARMGIRNRRTYLNIYISRDSIDMSKCSLARFARLPITTKMIPIKKRAGGHSLYFSSSLALLSSLLSCSFYLADQRTISGVEILKMTGKTAQSYYVLTTATFQAYRRLTVKCVRSRNVPI